MNINKNYREINNTINSYFNNINHTVEKLKIYLEDIANNNPYSDASKICMDIHSYCRIFQSQLDNAKKPFDKYINELMDENRPSVLYPYEKQAIWEYLVKLDTEHNCFKKFGCIYAEKISINGKEVVTIGFSICNNKDEFTKAIALALAKKRAREYPTRYDIRVTPKPKTFSSNTIRIPYQWMYENEIAKFIKRCTRWFKNETIIYPNNIDFTEFPKKTKKKHEPTGEKKEMPF